MRLDRNKVKIECIKRGWTLKDLAKALGCSPQNLYLILSRKGTRASTISRIAKAIGCSVTDILIIDD